MASNRDYRWALSLSILSCAALASNAVVGCGAFGAAEPDPPGAPGAVADGAAADGAAVPDGAAVADGAPADAASPMCNGSTTFGGDMSALPADFVVSPAPASPPSFAAGQMVAAASLEAGSWGSSTISRFFEGPLSGVELSWTATLPATDIQAEVGCRLHLAVAPSNQTIRLYFLHNGLSSLNFIADRLSPAVGVDEATLAAPHGPGTFTMALGATLSNGTLSLRADFNGKQHTKDIPLAETIYRAEVICGVYSAYNGALSPDTFTMRLDSLSGTVCRPQ